MRLRRALRWVLAGAVCGLPAAAVHAVVVWEAPVVRAISTLDFAIAEKRDVQVRVPDDSTKPQGDVTLQAFPELFRIDIAVTRRGTDADGFAQRETVSPLGTIFVATFAPRDAATTAIQSVVERLRIRSPQNARFPMPREDGGTPDWFTYRGSPFYTDPPTWICYESAQSELASQVLQQFKKTADGSPGWSQTSTLQQPSPHGSVCQRMRDALAEDTPGSKVSSRFAVETDGRRSLSFSVQRPGGGGKAVPFPEGSGIAWTETEGPNGTNSKLLTDTNPIELPLSLVRSTGIVLSWTLAQKASGQKVRSKAATADRRQSWTISLYLPFVERPAGTIAPDPVAWEERIAHRARAEYLDAVRTEIEGATSLDAAHVQQTIVEKLRALLPTEEALVVVCNDTNPARYYLYPAGIGGVVTNTDVFCPEMRRVVASLPAE